MENKHNTSNSPAKVYLVEEESCLHGDCMHNLIGVYSSLEKARDAYENAIIQAEEDFKPDEHWYKDENVQSTDRYFELMDDVNAPEKYYQLQLEERPLQ